MSLTIEQKQNCEALCVALEGGKYKQGRDRLRTGAEFCCLGVACEISGLGAWEHQGLIYVYNDGVGAFAHTLSGLLSVQKHYGMNGSGFGNFYTNQGRGCLSLTKMNDGGSSFTEIATAIRKYVKGH